MISIAFQARKTPFSCHGGNYARLGAARQTNQSCLPVQVRYLVVFQLVLDSPTFFSLHSASPPIIEDRERQPVHDHPLRPYLIRVRVVTPLLGHSARSPVLGPFVPSFLSLSPLLSYYFSSWPPHRLVRAVCYGRDRLIFNGFLQTRLVL